MKISQCMAYHYYDKMDGPLACLSKLPYEKALTIRHKFVESKNDRITYLKQRQAFERMMYTGFIAKGGVPKSRYPYYFVIGPKDIIREYYQFPAYLTIPVWAFDKAVISFTYCDSFLAYSRKDAHPTRRKIFTIFEIDEVIRNYGADFQKGDYMAFIEMQLWDDEPLRTYASKISSLQPDVRREKR